MTKGKDKGGLLEGGCHHGSLGQGECVGEAVQPVRFPGKAVCSV